MTDFNTMSEHLYDLLEERAELYERIHLLEDQMSYWREVALCSTAEVKSSTYDD
jgi:hypothetical protein